VTIHRNGLTAWLNGINWGRLNTKRPVRHQAIINFDLTRFVDKQKNASGQVASRAQTAPHQ
jgi:hypothetical protein